MTELQWNELPAGPLVASGDDWVYLIAQDDHMVVLTRWEPRPNQPVGEVAAQAALYAIQAGGAYAAVPESADVMVAHIKRTAQAFEVGIDAVGQPRWQHGYQPRTGTRRGSA